jgi:hypothetical protein
MCRVIRTPFERMMRKVKKQPGENGCWLFTGSCNPKNGYGKVRVKWTTGRRAGKWTLKGAHVISYEHHHGPVPEGCFVCHDPCDTPNCVAPHHLIAGPPKLNTYQMMTRGRWKNQHSKKPEYEDVPF